jgi:hypothetical protein
MKHKPRYRLKGKRARRSLRLPDLEHAKAAVLNSLTSVDAQRGYRHAIDEFVDWYCSEPRLAFNRTVVLRYRNHLETRQLAPGTINLRLGAVRRLAYEAADCGLLSTDLAAGIRRVKGVKNLGVRLGNWLTAEQGHALWQTPDDHRLKGKPTAPCCASCWRVGCGGTNWWPCESMTCKGEKSTGTSLIWWARVVTSAPFPSPIGCGRNWTCGWRPQA